MFCNKNYKDKTSLKVHMIGDHQTNPSSKDNPLSSNQGRLSKCPVCQKLLGTKNDLEKHIKREHGTTSREQYIQLDGEDEDATTTDVQLDEDYQNDVLEVPRTSSRQFEINVSDDDSFDESNDSDEIPRVVMIKLRKIFWPAEVLEVRGEEYEVQVCGRSSGGVQLVKKEDCRRFIPSPGITVAKNKVGLAKIS